MKVEVFGPGGTRCEQTYRTILNAAAELGIAADIQYVTDVATMAERGITLTPAVVVDGELVMTGQVPSPAKAKALLKKHNK
jgi:small redox-active disulfide protein 2